MSGSASKAFDLRALTTGVFLPHALVGIGQGATAPMIALVAIERGASAAGAGLVVALFALGALSGEIPAGILVSKLGERRLMVAGAAAVGAAALFVTFQPPLAIFAALVFLMGMSTAVFGLSRLVRSTLLSPIDRRGRVMSTVGGIQRIGMFLGPILGGLLIGPIGLTGPFFVNGVLALVAAGGVLAGPGTQQAEPSAEANPRLRDVLVQHRGIFGTATLAIVAFQIVRGSRQAIIPLWATGLGLDARQVGVLFSLTAAAEMLMFYPVGRLMDRRGRKSTAVPALTLLSLGVAAIPLTSDLLTLSIVVVLIGFANGLGTGINMTLSSDLSPERGRSVFLGLWRTITDAGTASGPSIVALVISIVSLGAASVVVAGVGLGGAWMLWRVVPETLRRD